MPPHPTQQNSVPPCLCGEKKSVTETNTNIRKLTTADVDEAADVLTRAFFDYPMLTWTMPDEARRRIALPIFLRASVRWGLLMNNVYGLGDPLRGVAVWAPPGKASVDLDPDDSIVRFREAATVMGADAEARYDRFLAEQHAVREREMGPRTWYLAWLAVDPAHQQTGTGTALLNDMFARLDAAGDDSYLETEEAANVPYYTQYGFEVVTENVISGGGPAFWTMRRS
jgi:ribosomal protein S18 acetylase RimI-like enzyme